MEEINEINQNHIHQTSQCHHSHQKIEIDKDAEIIDLTNLRLIQCPDLEGCTVLHTLILRQNMIFNLKKLTLMLRQYIPFITHIDLYENQIENIIGFDEVEGNFSSLIWLDLSFNTLRIINGLNYLTNLKELYLVQNKIRAISGVNHLHKLEILELGANRIRKIENVDELVNLKQLWLGRNKITEISNVDSLIQLEILSLQSNRLSNIGMGLINLENLKELHLSHNGLHSIDGLDSLINLQLLDLGNNKIQKIEGVNQLISLIELWLNDNEISTFLDLNEIIHLTKLRTLYLEHNPVYRDPEYKTRVLRTLPHLTQLDAEVFSL